MGTKRTLILGCFLITLASLAQAQDTLVAGKVTYISPGTVYVSIGRDVGVGDSTLLYAVSAKDTIAFLKVFAISSKSSACRTLSSKRAVVVGDNVVGHVPPPRKSEVTSATPQDTVGLTANQRPTLAGTQLAARKEPTGLMVKGRVGLQYYTSQFDNSSYNINQPGMIVAMHVASANSPLALEVYGNLRTLSRGGTNPFSGNETNQSRIYRLSLEYNDHTNVASLGRILSYYAPSIGSIDGISYGRRFGNFLVGASAGFQPDDNQQGVATDIHKMLVYTRYEQRDFYNLGFSAAYARTYASSVLDREAMSFMLTAYSSDGFSVYGYSDVDIRKKNDTRYELAPSISQGTFMVNYRLVDFLTLGLGADASRPVYRFTTVQFTADSLVDRTLRSGATLSLNIMLPGGVGLFNTYTPRSSGGPFGRDYANYSSFFWSNVLSSGAMVRATYNVTANDFTTGQGYGINVQRNFFGVDCTVRWLQSRYRISQLEQNNLSKTLGFDVMAPLGRKLYWITSFDSMKGYGSNMNSVYTELSWRF